MRSVQWVTLVGFNQGNQLAENFADVAPVDFVDHHRKSLIGRLPGLAAQFLERAGPNLIFHFARIGITVQYRAQTLDEFLVAIGLVEGHEAVALHPDRILLPRLELVD